MATRQYSQVIGAGGSATIVIQPRSNVQWRVTQVSIRCDNAPETAECEMQINGAFVTFAVPQGDALGEFPPVDVLPTDTLSIIWTGCTPGQNATALAFYVEEPL